MSERKMKSHCEKARETSVAGRSSMPKGHTAGGTPVRQGPRYTPLKAVVCIPAPPRTLNVAENSGKDRGRP